MNITITHDGHNIFVNFYYSVNDGGWIADYAGENFSGRVWLTDNLNVTVGELTDLLKAFL